MRAIVTGGARFIGSQPFDRLLSDGPDVNVVDNFDPFYARAVKEANLAGAARNPRCRPMELEIRDAGVVELPVSQTRPDAIVHHAARAGVRPSIAVPGLDADANVTRRVHWREAAARFGPHPRQPVDVRQNCADIARAATERGDAPKPPIAEGLARYVEWYRTAAA